MNFFNSFTLAAIFLALMVEQALAFDNSHLIADAQRDPEAQYTLAHLYLKGKGGIEFDVEEAIKLLERAAGSGHKMAAFDLALLYLNGTKVGKDNVKALQWLTRSAELGQSDAQYFLGLAYRKSDISQAAIWLKMAKDSGHQDAATELQRLCSTASEVCSQLD